MHLYESNSHEMMKAFKRSRGLLCLVNLVSGWAESSYTEDGDADSPTQSASTGDFQVEFQDQDLVTQQEPFETVQLPQLSAYSVVQQFARCPYDLDDALLQQLEPRTIVEQLLGGRHSAGFHVSVGERTRIISPAFTGQRIRLSRLKYLR